MSFGGVSEILSFLQLCQQVQSAIDQAQMDQQTAIHATSMIRAVASTINAVKNSRMIESQPSFKQALALLQSVLREIETCVMATTKRGVLGSSLGGLFGKKNPLPDLLNRLENAKSHLAWTVNLVKELPQDANDAVLNVEAETFWKKYWNDPKSSVEWPHFLECLEAEMGGICLSGEAGGGWEQWFRLSLDWNGDGSVSSVEFRRFLSFFGPLSQCISLVKDAVTYGWYKPQFTRTEAEALMQECGYPGYFILRPSTTGMHGLAVHYIDHNLVHQKLLIVPTQPPAPIGVKIHGDSQSYQNIHELLLYNADKFHLMYVASTDQWCEKPISMPEPFQKSIENELRQEGYTLPSISMVQARKK